jgi:DMSO reductase family type II enzyme chaperone
MVLPETVALVRTERSLGTEAATARSQCYQLLSRAFAFPEPDFFAAVKEGRWLAEGAAMFSSLPYPLRLPAGFRLLPNVDYDAFQTEYIRLFEVGPRGWPPCPLYSGHYSRDRLRVMEELVRFFNFFGLRLCSGRMPDHLTVELEFMHYLTYKEVASESAADADSYRQAQRDFLDRHLANWLPALEGNLRRQKPLPFYKTLVGLTTRFVVRDRSYLGRLDLGN